MNLTDPLAYRTFGAISAAGVVGITGYAVPRMQGAGFLTSAAVGVAAATLIAGGLWWYTTRDLDRDGATAQAAPRLDESERQESPTATAFDPAF